MKYHFPPHVPVVSVHGSERDFPVHRIYCVGKNYADHAREMGGDPAKEPPFFFSKPADAVAHKMAQLPFPGRTVNLHHEVELVVAIGREASQVDVSQAASCIFGYAVGVDLTRRDLQADAKQAGRPWDVAKGFDNSAPVSAIHPVSELGHLEGAQISLSVNGERRQHGNLRDMIWSVPEIIAELSSYFTLKPGDLVFTGTPAGVGRLQPGDTVSAEIEGLDSLSFRLV